MSNLATQDPKTPAPVKYSHPVLEALEKDGNKKRLVNILGDRKAELFVASLMSVINNDSLLKKADPYSIINAAMIAATLNLPINKNLGFAYILPYGTQAQFQMGYKGYIQLAERTGQIAKINVGTLSKEQFISFNPITEELKYDLTKSSGEPYAYIGYLKTINGFEKYLVMYKNQLEAHGRKYSKSYGTVWGTNFEAMATKTVIKKLLNTFAPLDTEMQVQQALTYDQASIDNKGNANYIDNANNITDATPTTPQLKNEADSAIDLSNKSDDELSQMMEQATAINN